MRLQSAIEYLTTYGWALLVIAVVMAAFFVLVNPTQSVTPQCVLPAGLSCTTFYMATNGLLSITLLQTTQTPINVTTIGCNSINTVSNMQAPYNPPTNQVSMQVGGTASFTTQCYSNTAQFSGNPGTTFTGYVFVNYTDVYTGFPHTAFGKLLVPIT